MCTTAIFLNKTTLLICRTTISHSPAALGLALRAQPSLWYASSTLITTSASVFVCFARRAKSLLAACVEGSACVSAFRFYLSSLNHQAFCSARYAVRKKWSIEHCCTFIFLLMLRLCSGKEGIPRIRVRGSIFELAAAVHDDFAQRPAVVKSLKLLLYF